MRLKFFEKQILLRLLDQCLEDGEESIIFTNRYSESNINYVTSLRDKILDVDVEHK